MESAKWLWVMTLSDKTLRNTFLQIDVMARRAVALHVLQGRKTQESRDALRWLRHQLKRRARSRRAERNGKLSGGGKFAMRRNETQ
jgi:hypothetical protein